jgi:cobalamin biosynthesis Mg chelatase CobN
MWEFVEYLWGWDATVRELVTDEIWKETFDVCVQDKDKLGMKEFFEKNSPFAYQDITARMEETMRKGYWKADEATEKKLLEEYLESVNKHGVGFAEHICGNPLLSKYVMDRAKALGFPTPLIEGFKQAMEAAIRQEISKAARAAEDFVQKNEQPVRSTTSRSAPKGSSPIPAHQGYVMDVTEKNRTNKPLPTMGANGDWDTLWVSFPVLALLFAWRFKHQRKASDGADMSGWK